MVAITEYVRATMKASPILYRAWLRQHSWRRRKAIKLPEPNDVLYLDGYPRSGNTYFTALVNQLEPQIKFANHLHVVAPIRIALGLKIPTFILMRNPEDAILSHMVHVGQFGGESGRSKWNSNELAGRLINDWLRYYEFVDRHSSRLTVILSEKGFKDPLGTIEHVFELAGVRKDPHRSAKYKNVHEQFTTRDATKAQGSTSYPSAERNRMKDSYRAVIEKSGRLDEARQLYGNVAARA